MQTRVDIRSLVCEELTYHPVCETKGPKPCTPPPHGPRPRSRTTPPSPPTPSSASTICCASADQLEALYLGARVPRLTNVKGDLRGRMLAIPALHGPLAELPRALLCRSGSPGSARASSRRAKTTARASTASSPIACPPLRATSSANRARATSTPSSSTTTCPRTPSSSARSRMICEVRPNLPPLAASRPRRKRGHPRSRPPPFRAATRPARTRSPVAQRRPIISPATALTCRARAGGATTRTRPKRRGRESAPDRQ